jgi:putative SOS response-associated peptidase YedK
MCGRFAITQRPADLAKYFAVEGLEFPPRYNVAPTQPIVAVMEQHGRRRMALVRWGLVPGWVKDPREFSLVINARSETMAEKPAFRDALKHGRCIVPASGYYEWQAGPSGKQPWYITRADGQPMLFAGLYATWMGPNGEEIDSAAIVTTPASADMAFLHPRMPAILSGAAVEDWLNVREVRAGAAAQLALPLPEGSLRYHPVSTRVNGANPNDPDLITPVTVEPPKPKPTPKPAQLDLF